MCLSQCINHFCPDPKPSHQRPRGGPVCTAAPRAAPLPLRARSLSFTVSALSPFALASRYTLLDRNANTCVYACGYARACAHRRRGPHVRPYGRGDESNRHRSACSPSPLPPFPFRHPSSRPADSSSSPSWRHDCAGLRAFLMLNVAFCLCGCMGDSGERQSPGQRFFQMLNARFVPTHPVCLCYVASTGSPGTSQRTRQLCGLVIGIARFRCPPESVSTLCKVSCIAFRGFTRNIILDAPVALKYCKHAWYMCVNARGKL